MSAFNNNFRLNQAIVIKVQNFCLSMNGIYRVFKLLIQFQNLLILFYMSKYKRVAINDFNLQNANIKLHIYAILQYEWINK